MHKKSFFSGLITGVVTIAVCFGLLNTPAVSNVFFSNSVNTRDKKIDYITSLLDRNFIGDVDKDTLEDGMYWGMVASLGDPYTSYMNSSETSSFFESNEGAFYGIGIEINTDPIDNSILVHAPMEGTPAERAGIQIGDRIRQIDHVDVSSMNLNQAVDMIKGEKGSVVTLTIYRESEDKTFDVDIVRDEIKILTVKSKVLEGNIGYIKLSHFKKNTYEEFMAAYNSLMDQNVSAMIIDVRNNPGGLLTVVQDITDTLVPEGTFVYTIDKAGNRKDSLSDANCIEIPLCLLVNGNSASASEILAGAVQDMDVGELVGTQTFGKGLVQNIFPLPDGSSVKVTIQKYYTPRGVCIQGEGITPDYVVDLPEELVYQLNIDESEDVQLHKAIEVLKNKI